MIIKIKKTIFATLVLVLSVSVTSYADVRTGEMAPDFTLSGADGKTYLLSQFRGKNVVLEWTNHGCPFVRKHYDSGNMQALQKEYLKKGVIWLSIISSAPGKQGYSTPEEAKKDIEKYKAFPTAVLLDTSGKIGKLYGAKTTPHMFVVDARGYLVYQGAIDDRPSTEVADVKGAKNYVKEALEATLAGRAVAMDSTKSYGCSVKY